MKGSVSDKMLLLQKIKKGARKESEKRAATTKKNNRVLITVTVIGSAGPIRFIVNEDDRVSLVIGCTLKSYALEGRLPVLGSDPTHFLLYCSADCKVIYSNEPDGSYRVERRKELRALQAGDYSATARRQRSRDEYST